MVEMDTDRTGDCETSHVATLRGSVDGEKSLRLKKEIYVMLFCMLLMFVFWIWITDEQI
jgi:hypothetical protein